MADTVSITLPPAMGATYWSDPDPEGSSGIHPTEQCPSCRGLVDDGDPVRKVGGQWMHDACAVTAITTADVDAAWLLLADMVAARPSKFRASDIKAVMSNVARIARNAG